MTKKAKISAVIITLNEEENIEKCLEALKGVATEIIIVDAFSEDKTVEICERMGTKIVQKEWEGYSINKNYGHSLSQNDWITQIHRMGSAKVPVDGSHQSKCIFWHQLYDPDKEDIIVRKLVPPAHVAAQYQDPPNYDQKGSQSAERW